MHGDSINQIGSSKTIVVDLKEGLEWVLYLDPEIDAYESINKKFFRFIGYYPSHMTHLFFIPRDRVCSPMIWKINSNGPRIVGSPSPQDRKEPNLELTNRLDNYLTKYNSVIQSYLIETAKVEGGEYENQSHTN